MDQLSENINNSQTTPSGCTIRNLVEAVAKIRHQKQCANVVRIHKAVRQQLQKNIDVEEVLQQLNVATNNGSLWRVDNNGVTSYREPPKGSSKEQLRWSQKDASKWSNKDLKIKSNTHNAAKLYSDSYKISNHAMLVPDQFNCWPAQRWSDPNSWKLAQRQNFEDSMIWPPMNESFKRQIMNESFSWPSTEQYKLSVHETFHWSLSTDQFPNWSSIEPWRQTMIDQFKKSDHPSSQFSNLNNGFDKNVYMPNNYNHRFLMPMPCDQADNQKVDQQGVVTKSDFVKEDNVAKDNKNFITSCSLENNIINKNKNSLVEGVEQNIIEISQSDKNINKEQGPIKKSFYVDQPQCLNDEQTYIELKAPTKQTENDDAFESNKATDFLAINQTMQKPNDKENFYKTLCDKPCTKSSDSFETHSFTNSLVSATPQTLDVFCNDASNRIASNLYETDDLMSKNSSFKGNYKTIKTIVEDSNEEKVESNVKNEQKSDSFNSSLQKSIEIFSQFNQKTNIEKAVCDVKGHPIQTPSNHKSLTVKNGGKQESLLKVTGEMNEAINNDVAVQNVETLENKPSQTTVQTNKPCGSGNLNSGNVLEKDLKSEDGGVGVLKKEEFDTRKNDGNSKESEGFSEGLNNLGCFIEGKKMSKNCIKKHENNIDKDNQRPNGRTIDCNYEKCMNNLEIYTSINFNNAHLHNELSQQNYNETSNILKREFESKKFQKFSHFYSDSNKFYHNDVLNGVRNKLKRVLSLPVLNCFVPQATNMKKSISLGCVFSSTFPHSQEFATKDRQRNLKRSAQSDEDATEMPILVVQNFLSSPSSNQPPTKCRIITSSTEPSMPTKCYTTITASKSRVIMASTCVATPHMQSTYLPLPICSIRTTTQSSTLSSTDAHLRGLVDGLTRFFTPSNKRSSRVSQNTLNRINNNTINNMNHVNNTNKRYVRSCNKERILPIINLDDSSSNTSSPLSNAIFSKKSSSPNLLPPLPFLKKLISTTTPLSTGTSSHVTSASKSTAITSSTTAPTVKIHKDVKSCSDNKLPLRKSRKEQLFDGLSHFFAAEGKRKTRHSKIITDSPPTKTSRISNEVNKRATDSIEETVPRKRSHSISSDPLDKNKCTRRTPLELKPLQNTSKEKKKSTKNTFLENPVSIESNVGNIKNSNDTDIKAEESVLRSDGSGVNDDVLVNNDKQPSSTPVSHINNIHNNCRQNGHGKVILSSFKRDIFDKNDLSIYSRKNNLIHKSKELYENINNINGYDDNNNILLKNKSKINEVSPLVSLTDMNAENKECKSALNTRKHQKRNRLKCFTAAKKEKWKPFEKKKYLSKCLKAKKILKKWSFFGAKMNKKTKNNVRFRNSRCIALRGSSRVLRTSTQLNKINTSTSIKQNNSFNKYAKRIKVNKTILDKIASVKPNHEDNAFFKKSRELASQKTKDLHWEYNQPQLSHINFGGHYLDATFLSNYPSTYSSMPVLHICEFCLDYFKTSLLLQSHQAICTQHRPPGNEIYRSYWTDISSEQSHLYNNQLSSTPVNPRPCLPSYSVYEVDAALTPLYCERLLMMSRLFVEPDLQPLFTCASHLFYILTLNHDHSSRLVGYFIRDKQTVKGKSMCFLFVLPPHRRKGCASFLINFSYQLCRLLGTTGNLVRTFSVPLLSAFHKYWCWAVVHHLKRIYFKTGACNGDGGRCEGDGRRAGRGDEMRKEFDDVVQQAIKNNNKKPVTVGELSASLGIPCVHVLSTLLKLGVVHSKINYCTPFIPNLRALELNLRQMGVCKRSISDIKCSLINCSHSVLLRNVVVKSHDTADVDDSGIYMQQNDLSSSFSSSSFFSSSSLSFSPSSAWSSSSSKTSSANQTSHFEPASITAPLEHLTSSQINCYNAATASKTAVSNKAVTSRAAASNKTSFINTTITNNTASIDTAATNITADNDIDVTKNKADNLTAVFKNTAENEAADAKTTSSIHITTIRENSPFLTKIAENNITKNSRNTNGDNNHNNNKNNNYSNNSIKNSDNNSDYILCRNSNTQSTTNQTVERKGDLDGTSANNNPTNINNDINFNNNNNIKNNNNDINNDNHKNTTTTNNNVNKNDIERVNEVTTSMKGAIGISKSGKETRTVEVQTDDYESEYTTSDEEEEEEDDDDKDVDDKIGGEESVSEDENGGGGANKGERGCGGVVDKDFQGSKPREDNLTDSVYDVNYINNDNNNINNNNNANNKNNSNNNRNSNTEQNFCNEKRVVGGSKGSYKVVIGEFNHCDRQPGDYNGEVSENGGKNTYQMSCYHNGNNNNIKTNNSINDNNEKKIRENGYPFDENINRHTKSSNNKDFPPNEGPYQNSNCVSSGMEKDRMVNGSMENGMEKHGSLMDRSGCYEQQMLSPANSLEVDSRIGSLVPNNTSNTNLLNNTYNIIHYNTPNEVITNHDRKDYYEANLKRCKTSLDCIGGYKSALSCGAVPNDCQQTRVKTVDSLSPSQNLQHMYHSADVRYNAVNRGLANQNSPVTLNNHYSIPTPSPSNSSLRSFGMASPNTSTYSNSHFLSQQVNQATYQEQNQLLQKKHQHQLQQRSHQKDSRFFERDCPSAPLTRPPMDTSNQFSWNHFYPEHPDSYSFVRLPRKEFMQCGSKNSSYTPNSDSNINPCSKTQRLSDNQNNKNKKNQKVKTNQPLIARNQQLPPNVAIQPGTNVITNYNVFNMAYRSHQLPYCTSSCVLPPSTALMAPHSGHSSLPISFYQQTPLAFAPQPANNIYGYNYINGSMASQPFTVLKQ